MPADNVKRAILKGTGQLEGAAFEEVIYEGYGPGGVAIFLQALTDNKNRTVSEIRHIFMKNGGQMSEKGSVAWMFKRMGYIDVEKAKAVGGHLMDIALTAGADDIKDEGSLWEVTTSPEKYEAVLEAIKKAEIEIADSERRLHPPELRQGRGQGGPAGPAARRGARGPRRRPDSVSGQLRHLDEEEIATLLAGLSPGGCHEGPRHRSQPPVHRVRDRRGSRTAASVPIVFGVIKPTAEAPLHPTSSHEIKSELEELIRTYAPEEASIENAFYAQNMKTALLLGQVRGAILVAVAATGCGLAEYSALEIKKAVTGYGQADKEQVLTMVRSLLDLEDDAIPLDASDALAAAICHLNCRLFQAQGRGEGPDMIAYLKGTLIDKTPGRVVIDTGGVGYAAAIPLSTFFKLGEIGADGRAPHPHPPHRRRPLPLTASRRAKRRTCSSSSSASPGSAPSWP